MALQLITASLLDTVSDEARQAPRLRKNRNFHPHNDFPAHRLLNAVEPGSYIPPHRHNDPSKDETMIVLRGALGLVTFDPQGQVASVSRLEAHGECLGCDIPHGTYHTVLALMPGTVFFEAKAGPYAALDDAEKAAWAPQEGDAGAGDYLSKLESLFARGSA